MGAPEAPGQSVVRLLGFRDHAFDFLAHDTLYSAGQIGVEPLFQQRPHEFLGQLLEGFIAATDRRPGADRRYQTGYRSGALLFGLERQQPIIFIDLGWFGFGLRLRFELRFGFRLRFYFFENQLIVGSVVFLDIVFFDHVG